jgi:hypothetical protein
MNGYTRLGVYLRMDRVGLVRADFPSIEAGEIPNLQDSCKLTGQRLADTDMTVEFDTEPGEPHLCSTEHPQSNRSIHSTVGG